MESISLTIISFNTDRRSFKDLFLKESLASPPDISGEEEETNTKIHWG